MLIGLILIGLLCVVLSVIYGLYDRKISQSLQKGQQNRIDETKTALEKLTASKALGEISDEDFAAKSLFLKRDLLSYDKHISPPLKPFIHALVLSALFITAFLIFRLSHTPLYVDFPYERQLALWTKVAQSDPQSLPPKALVAVMRQAKAKQENDPNFWLLLARLEVEAEYYYSAAQSFSTSRSLDLKNYRAFSEEGEANHMFARAKETSIAKSQFEEALKIDPKDGRALYYLGKYATQRGEYDTAEELFNTILPDLSADDPRRQQVSAELERISVSRQNEQARKGQINAMVSSLAQKLTDDPKNEQGWARLLRAYLVLGRKDDYEAALSSMKKAIPERRAQEKILKDSQKPVGKEAF